MERRTAAQRISVGLSPRRYPGGLEPVSQQVEAVAHSTATSAVSRPYIAGTETALAELLTDDLSG